MTVMELVELCRISEKYAMDENKSTRAKVVLERKGLTYSRSIRSQGGKRVTRTRSNSLPALPIMPPKPFTALDLQGNIQNTDPIPVEEDNMPESESVRVRQFSTTMKGLINKGDLRKDSRRDSGFSGTSLRRDSSVSISSTCGNIYGRRDSVFSENASRRQPCFASGYATPLRRTSCITARECMRLGQKYSFSLPGSQDSILDEHPQEYRVLVLGASGVGKTAIVSQFTTSEFLGSSDIHTDANTENTTISVILNKEESLMDLIEETNLNAFQESSDYDVDAFMIVYSCADRNSFKAASNTLHRLKEEIRSNKTVMIVANKVDLARGREVNYEEGRILAHSHNCKYIETSAALNHNVDELLAGVLSQIRLKQYSDFVKDNMIGPKKQRPQKGITRVLKTAFRGVFGKKQKISSCENLYEI